MSLQIILINALVVVSGFCIYLVVTLIKGNTNQSETLERFISNIQQNQKTRLILVAQFLKDGLGISDQGLTEDLAASEKRYLKSIVKAFYTRDQEELLQLEDDLYLLLSQYHALSRDVPASAPAPAAESPPSKNTEEVSKLKAENLHAVKAINLVFHEYCTMFGEQTDSSDLLSVDEILERINDMGRDSSRQISGEEDIEIEDIDADDQLLAATIQSSSDLSEAAFDDMSMDMDDDIGAASQVSDMMSDDILADMLTEDDSPMDGALADIDDILNDSSLSSSIDDDISSLLDDEEDPQAAIDRLMAGEGIEDDMDMDDIASLLEDSDFDDK